jgi:hypothetical protein
MPKMPKFPKPPKLAKMPKIPELALHKERRWTLGTLGVAAIVIVHDWAGVVYTEYGKSQEAAVQINGTSVTVTSQFDWVKLIVTIGMCALTLLPFVMGAWAERLKPEMEAEMEQEVSDFTNASIRKIKHRAVDMVLRRVGTTDVVPLVQALPGEEFNSFKQFVLPIIAPGKHFTSPIIVESQQQGQLVAAQSQTDHIPASVRIDPPNTQQRYEQHESQSHLQAPPYSEPRHHASSTSQIHKEPESRSHLEPVQMELVHTISASGARTTENQLHAQEPVEPESQRHSHATIEKHEIASIRRRSHRSLATGLVDQDQQTRLEEAYQTLLKQGKLSGRKLAPLAHVHRTTASAWLEARSQKPKAEPPIMEPALTNNDETDFNSERHLTSEPEPSSERHLTSEPALTNNGIDFDSKCHHASEPEPEPQLGTEELPIVNLNEFKTRITVTNRINSEEEGKEKKLAYSKQ